MHRIRTLFVLLATLTLCAPPATPQALPGPGGTIVFGQVAATGVLGQYADFSSYSASPATHTVYWSNAGAAATACTFQVEISPNHVTWDPVGNSTGVVFSCNDVAAGTQNHITFTSTPATFVRVRVNTYTAGSGTTAVVFSYTRGGQN